MKKILGIFVVSVLLSACGSDGGSKSKVTLDATQQAQVVESSNNVVEAGVALSALKTNPGEGNTFTALGNVYANASQLWGTKMAAQAGTTYKPTLDTIGQALTEGCYTTNGSTSTYNCNEGGTTIVGTITVNGDNVVIDLTIGSYGGTFVYKGDITVTATEIDGWISFSMDQNQGGMDISYDVEITYNTVVLDANGCPTSGSLLVDVNVETSGIEGMPSGYGGFDYPNVEVVFGPLCGDVTMY
jgi:hypothetical protein